MNQMTKVILQVIIVELCVFGTGRKEHVYKNFKFQNPKTSHLCNKVKVREKEKLRFNLIRLEAYF